ncbi:MAG: DUF2499 domain-containing protein [cyanobacterium endosymbiont of Rhopalodia yunnanensis]
MLPILLIAMCACAWHFFKKNPIFKLIIHFTSNYNSCW